MMTLLPGSTPEGEVMTAEKICSLGADEARIYPTVILKGTKKKKMADEGKYNIPTVEESVKRGCDVLEVFVKNNVNVIRIGLCSSDLGEDDISKNTFQPAIGEMIESELFLRKADEIISKTSGTEGKNLRLECPLKCTSKVVGQRRKNTMQLKSKYGFNEVKIVEKDDLFGYNIKCIFI